MLQISVLDLSQECHSESAILPAIDIVNILLSALILFIFVKLAYDYYHYKKSGKLPWIVTILP